MDQTPSAILTATYALIRDGQYEDALVRLLWFHRHAAAIDPAQVGVRLSFALRNWVELGKQYPRARQELAAIRDGDAQALAAGTGSRASFQDVQAINRSLDESHRTVELFRVLHDRWPNLARGCYVLAEEDLAAAQAFALCSTYLDDPAARLATMVANRDRLRAFEAGHPPHFPKAADRLFTVEAARILTILSRAGREAEAEPIRDQALAEVDGPEFRRILVDAA